MAHSFKSGVLVVHTEGHGANIGDYIQAIAASQFVGDEFEFIERERLDEYSGDDVVVIMNGWFMHHTVHWPPSKSIHPVFVSFHIVPYAAEAMLNKEGVAYLKQFEPIGCRDKTTVALLQDHGVEAYFSGCLTLTLGAKYKFNGTRRGVYFAEPYYYVDSSVSGVLKASLTLVSRFISVKRVAGKVFGRYSLKNLLKASMFYMQYCSVFDREIVDRFTYIRHEGYEYIKYSNEELLLQADQLLRCYLQAELVVTSRIHCALPCTAMGTPVLFVYDHNDDYVSSSRLPGIFDFFNVITNKKGRMSAPFLADKKELLKIDGGLPRPKTNWKSYADELSRTVNLLLSSLK